MRRPPPLLKAPHFTSLIFHLGVSAPPQSPVEEAPVLKASIGWMRKVAASSALVSPGSGVLGAALRLGPGPITPLSTPEGSSHLAPLCQSTPHREWDSLGTLIASASFREMVPVGTRARNTSHCPPPICLIGPAACYLHGQLCPRGPTSLKFFSTSHPGQVPPAPIHPLGTQQLASTELSTWGGGLCDGKRSAPARVLDVGAGFRLPGPWPRQPTGWMLTTR